MLFTDLVGSTELRSRLGEQAAEELRRKHDHLLSNVVEANEGRVVKGLGDGIMATFAGASHAVSAAVGMQQALHRHNRSADARAPLEVRIGMSAGDVTVEEGDCFGTPVIEAARLCAAASSGQILVSEMVRWLVRGGDHRFSPVGALDLKGLPDPVPACEVAWEPPAVSVIPRPPLLTDVGRIFVGRDDELHRLRRLWKEVVAGTLRVALVAGEPGVGKTRLAAELAEQAHADGATVLAGRCDEDLGVPYQPFVEALRHLVEHTPVGELPARLGRHAGELARLLPELAGSLSGLPPPLRADPETERYRLFDAVSAWLAAASGEEPVLLVLDDLQWAAKPTLLLLRHIVRSPEPLQLMILGTYRDTELRHEHPLVDLLADLRRHSEIERLSLSGMDEGAVATFMARAAGHEMDDEGLALARAIHTETEGNPFFVREVIRHLTETGAIQQQDGRWVTSRSVDDLGIPEGVREVVGSRLSRLSADANGALRVAAVIGTEFEIPVLQESSGLDGESLLTALEESINARLVAEVPGPPARYRFGHALVRDTLYRELSSARRVNLHRKVAEAIEHTHSGALDDQLPALAHHWSRASAAVADGARAVGYATRAGDRALVQLAHDEAASYYRQALDLLDAAGVPPEDARRVELLISRGEAQRRAGDPAHRDTLLEAGRVAREVGDAEASARAALANQRGLFSRMFDVDHERVAALDEALRALGPSPTPTRARLLASLASELYFARDDRRHDLGKEALTIARQLGDPATLAQVLAAVWYATWDPATLEQRAELVVELAELASSLGDHLLEFQAGIARFLTTMQQGDITGADAALDLCARVSPPSWASRCWAGGCSTPGPTGKWRPVTSRRPSAWPSRPWPWARRPGSLTARSSTTPRWAPSA